ncbi:hypothetical protein KIN20_023966 [Parelaphostrongylus tenuis]|uniref:Uncharacterized protein n=1 Tax=Parelaphostrongylus tenuis TaxID=148309 RepID=A0AAD5QVN3_PARTN|nr:hypothetical protein KIN20_004335 [Parelaphostrongylus tenuis]KAJ1363985.1 hypothetical protein KIN20_023966 [Parelaphostrongylus tenuis]
MMDRSCIIVGSTVIAICTNMGAAMMPCNVPPAAMVKVAPVSGALSAISGILSTANITMANWSRSMWQSVVNRAVRVSALGPFGSQFFSATAAVGGS